jgi:cobalt/nickel transport system ATP-binding protein
MSSDPATPDPILEVHDLHYSYLDRYPALAGVSLSVERGEKLALVGANGCGKSTLLKVLDGLVFPDSGSFRAFGADVTERHLEDEQFNRGFRSRVGFIFQNSDAQVFAPTVREELAFGPLNMGMTVADASDRVDDILELLEITKLADRAPYQLSGGEKKRVAIASVLVMNPEVLLFDEPTAGLDPRTQQWLMELIIELNDAGKTIVLATHDLDTLEVMADRCAVFTEGHALAAVVAPAELLTDEDFLLLLNLTHTHLHRHGDRLHAHPHDGTHHADAETPVANR